MYYKYVTCHYDSKTSCFGANNLPLSSEKDAFFNTKTTCFVIQGSISSIL